jgi:hypothetical protein
LLSESFASQSEESDYEPRAKRRNEKKKEDLKEPKRRSLKVTKCPHTESKHYAKVTLPLLTIFLSGYVQPLLSQIRPSCSRDRLRTLRSPSLRKAKVSELLLERVQQDQAQDQERREAAPERLVEGKGIRLGIQMKPCILSY